MKIVFMGTPDFAVQSLDAILKAGFEVPLVVTTPDKYGGRGSKQLLQSSIKTYCLENNLPHIQPEKLRDPAFVKTLKDINADLFVVVAFRMLPQVVWKIPSKGTLNLHGSLLPAYRGAAPINWAIINGEKTTGLTTFFINEEIDTGNIIQQIEIPISMDDDFGSLYSKMMRKGADLLIETLKLIETKSYKLTEQDPALASHAPKLNRENCYLDKKQKALDMYNFIRGLSPYPATWTEFEEDEVKIYKAKLSELPSDKSIEWEIYNKKLYINGLDNKLEIVELQPKGKKRMQAIDFINGLANKKRTTDQ
jgi:methionyl-tRNA formyltransferase